MPRPILCPILLQVRQLLARPIPDWRGGTRSRVPPLSPLPTPLPDTHSAHTTADWETATASLHRLWQSHSPLILNGFLSPVPGNGTVSFCPARTPRSLAGVFTGR
ncbi:MAG: hypothetical protein IPL78_33700 [Chloroflexi bacterium]|nr:hypothetical protein [Chloroflexota bacterium]